MQNRNDAESVAEGYYDSSDADKFYEVVWGGEDIHVGLYEPGDTISEASRKTVAKMASLLETIGTDSNVIDLGAGYGGSPRYLALTFGCHVTAVNISEVENERDRMLNREQGLDDKIDVVHGSFEQVPAEDASQDIVWSQDAFLHSGDREKVVAEIDRITKSGSEVIFTDPMQADDCPKGVLQPVYDRLSLNSLGSFAFYKSEFAKYGFEERNMLEMTHQLRNHYATVKEQLESRYDDLLRDISKDYMDRMITGLGNWVKAADSGYLAWGILHFRKQ